MDHFSLHPSQSSAAVQASWAVRFVALRTSRSQLLHGLPGFCLQPESGVVSASNSTDAWRASCAMPILAGVWRVQSLLSSTAARTSGRSVSAATHELVTKSSHLIPQVCGVGTLRAKLVVICHQLWEWYDWTQDVYIYSFVLRLEPECFQTLSNLPNRLHYGFFIRLAVVASRNREIVRNSD